MIYPGTRVKAESGGADSPAAAGRDLRLLSYNIQAGIDTRQYRDYVTKGWKHLLPNRERLRNLNLIAEMIHGYDLVGLQEVDSGSLRSGFVDMTEYLAHRGGYPHWYRQVNRNMGVLAQHSNGFLSRIRPTRVSNHRLPPGNGRGAMLLEFGDGPEALVVCSLHLGLSRRVRGLQLGFINELVCEYKHLVVMGDLNAGCDSSEVRTFIDKTGLTEPACNQATFPSWRPVRRIDHILVSHALEVTRTRVVDYALSDHLPICVELALPEGVRLAA
jgi:endonuclease/exonuclease/phosphatase family metal-dependent hydrolase